jgi:SAM-dependent methyltransferase
MNLREIYDGFSETYEQNRGLFDMADVLNPFYKSLGIKNGNLLDLGCGAGEPFGRYFIDRGWKVTGVDFSKQMLKLATKYVPEMHAIQADMCEVDFEPGKFDAITAIYSLFHVSRNDHAALFEQIYRWLCPGGKALFTYATKEYVTPFRASFGLRRYMPPYPAVPPPIRFLFVRPALCLRLPPDSRSPATPLPFG